MARRVASDLALGSRPEGFRSLTETIDPHRKVLTGPAWMNVRMNVLLKTRRNSFRSVVPCHVGSCMCSRYKLQDLVMNLARARVHQEEPTGWHQEVVVITASLSVCLHLSLGDGAARLAEEVETLEGGVERFQDVLVWLDDGLTTALLAVSVEERRLAGLALHGRGLLRNTNTPSRLDSYRFSLSPE